MNGKLKVMVSVLVSSLLSLSSLAMSNQEAKKGLNIAVAGGGGVNAYASLVMAVKLAQTADAPFRSLFDQFWGISGGTIPATLLMSKKYRDEDTIALFKSTVDEAFPSLLEFLDTADSTGARRHRFESELMKQFSDFSFGREKSNSFVYVASSDGHPVYFCDPEIKLPESALRCTEGTSCVKGIVGSSSFTSRINLGFFQTNVSLFKEEALAILPHGDEKLIRDGGHCYATHEDKHILDGFTPTPLVIDYLKTIPGNHNVVVFDNGGPRNQAFRESISVDEDGMATIAFAEGNISLYVISVHVENFEMNAINKTPAHLVYLEQQVEQAVSEASSVPFYAAMTAVTKK